MLSFFPLFLLSLLRTRAYLSLPISLTHSVRACPALLPLIYCMLKGIAFHHKDPLAMLRCFASVCLSLTKTFLLVSVVFSCAGCCCVFSSRKFAHHDPNRKASYSESDHAFAKRSELELVKERLFAVEEELKASQDSFVTVSERPLFLGVYHNRRCCVVEFITWCAQENLGL